MEIDILKIEVIIPEMEVAVSFSILGPPSKHLDGIACQRSCPQNRRVKRRCGEEEALVNPP